MKSLGSRAIPSAALLALLVVIAAIYFRSLQFPFLLLDDDINLVDAAWRQSLSWRTLLNFYTDMQPAMPIYMPLTQDLWAAVLWLGDGAVSPFPFHLLNVALHLLNVILVYVIFRKLFFSEQSYGALIASGIFALHPLQVESVAWISACSTLVLTFFGLSALWLHIRAVEKNSCRWEIASMVCHLFSLAAKPGGVVFFPLVLLVDLTVLKRPIKLAALRLGAGVLMTVPFFLISTALHPAEKLWGMVSAWLRPAIALDAMGFYLQKLIFPFQLTVDYGRNPSLVLNQPSFWIHIAMAVGCFIGAYLLRKRAGWVLGTLIALTIAFSPTLGLVPFMYQCYSTVSDRYAYIPVMIFGYFVAKLIQLTNATKVAPVLLAALSVLSLLQLEHWESEEAPFRRAVALRKDGRLGHSGMGRYYFRQNDFERAAHHYRLALDKFPPPSHGWASLALATLSMGKAEEAIPMFEKALTTDPNNLSTVGNYGIALLRAGKLEDGIRVLTQAQKQFPTEQSFRQLLHEARQALN